MHKNLTTREAHARLGIAAVILGVALLSSSSNLKILLAVLSSVLAGTAVLRFCPFYRLFRINKTTKTEQSTSQTITATELHEQNED